MQDTIHLPNDFRLVSAGQGAKWVSDGFALFMKQPGMWILIWMIWALIQLVAAIVPMGSLAMTLLTPVFTAGFMIAAAWRAKDEELDIAYLFSGFKRLKPLLCVGLVGLLAQFTLAMIFMVVVASILLSSGITSETLQPLATLDGKDPTQQAALLSAFVEKLGPGVLSGLLFTALTTALLYAVLMFGLSFAPALVALSNLSPMTAIRLSFQAVFANWLPFTIYGLIAMLLTFIAAIPLLLGFLVVSPLLIATIYIAYKDIFPDLQEHLNSD